MFWLKLMQTTVSCQISSSTKECSWWLLVSRINAVSICIMVSPYPVEMWNDLSEIKFKFKCAYWCLNFIQYKVRFLLGMLGTVTRSDSEGLKTWSLGGRGEVILKYREELPVGGKIAFKMKSCVWKTVLSIFLLKNFKGLFLTLLLYGTVFDSSSFLGAMNSRR